MASPYQPVNNASVSYLTFQIASSAMAGGAAVALGALFLAQLNDKKELCYSSGLSLAICVVAYINYSSMVGIRLRRVENTPKNQNQYSGMTTYSPVVENDDFAITCLRYADWLITMPLLALKLLNLARDGPSPINNDLLTSKYIDATISLLAFFMIFSAVVSLLSVGDFNTCRYDTGPLMLLRWVLYVFGLGCLVAIYLILFITTNRTESPHAPEIYGFALIWVLYPIVFVAQMIGFCGDRKDMAYAVLDVISKPLLSVYVARISLI